MPTRAPYSRWLQVSQSGKNFPNGETMRGSGLASGGGFSSQWSSTKVTVNAMRALSGQANRGASVSVRNAWCV